VALACVGRDMIKVWPLPAERPWWEDAQETPDGEPARRTQDRSCRSTQTCGIEIANTGV
jgi:hypothetical protein